MKIAILIIGLISVYDVYLTVIYAEYIAMMERNLVAKWIIHEFGVYPFVAVKSCTTLLVCVICFFLSKTKYKIAIYGVLIYQVCLFLALNFWTDGRTTKAHFSDGFLLFNEKDVDK